MSYVTENDGLIRRAPRALLFIWTGAAHGACTQTVAPDAGSGPRVDVSKPVVGVPDRGGDPAVVAIDVGGQMTCTGSLLAPDVVVTARHCVAWIVAAACQTNASDAPTDRAANSLRVLVGDDTTTAVEGARGRTLFVPEGDAICGADVALVALDRPIDGIRPLTVRSTGAAKGARVRSVGFDSDVRLGPGAGKVVRDHVAVVEATERELTVVEGAWDTGGGGPALDETSGEIVGVMSRAAPGASTDVYTRTDAFLSLVAQALAQSSPAPSTGQKARKGPADMGAHCSRGSDCAAGACVIDEDKQYCSRTCSADDRCPVHFRCERCAAVSAEPGDAWAWACVQH